jgi:predicted enzyme related to lactoylglutathione lyase
VDTTQPDPEAGVAFYRRLFGWEFEQGSPPVAGGRYDIARLRGGDVAAVASRSESDPATAVWNTYIWVDDADEAAAKVVAAGGRVLTGPMDVSDAGRTATCADREGATFRLWQANRHKGARIVNEPGSLNFNGLNVRDIDGATSFYRSVFGWETSDMGAGMRAWRLPGYGDFLERLDPGLRERMAGAGAPAGFEDAVATLNPITEEQGDVPPHWSVTFAVDDPDTVAATTADLGGHVVVAPIDAPWVRMTVVSDPQGATFAASKFVPQNKDLDGPTEAEDR